MPTRVDHVQQPVRVLVVDDSPLFVAAISEILSVDPEIEEVGVAVNGEQAVEMTVRLRPKIVIMDVQMPVMGGLDAISAIMARSPTPILVMTGDPRGRSGWLSFEALRRGALDLVSKPTWPCSADEAVRLRQHIKFLAGVAVVHHTAGAGARPPVVPRRPPAPSVAADSSGAVAIVASTGGPAALRRIFAALPAGFSRPLLVVQHLAGDFAPTLASWLAQTSALRVQVVTGEERLQPASVLIAPHDRHLLVQGDSVTLTRDPPWEGHRPSGNVLLHSLAECFGPRGVGLVLTGMGRDGADGLLALRHAGGLTAAQDEASSTVYGMPKAAHELGAAMHQLSLDHIVDLLLRISESTAVHPRGVR